MASRYYGINRGQTEFSVAEGSSTNTKDVELVVDLAKNLTKAEVIEKIDEIKNHVLKGNWPPA